MLPRFSGVGSMILLGNGLCCCLCPLPKNELHSRLVEDAVVSFFRPKQPRICHALIIGVLARFEFIPFQKSDGEEPCATVRAHSLFRSSTL